jgi:hypothetical protein
VTASDLGAILHYAMRYAMGHFTYAVDDVTRIIREQWYEIGPEERRQIYVDLDVHVARHAEDGRALGDMYQAARWIELRDWMLAGAPRADSVGGGGQ